MKAYGIIFAKKTPTPIHTKIEENGYFLLKVVNKLSFQIKF